MILERLQEINDRKLEIRGLLEGKESVNLDEIKAELDGLEKEDAELRAKMDVAKKINAGEIEVRKIEKPDEKREEKGMELRTRDSAEYRNAWLKNLQGNPLSEVEQRDMVVAGVPGAIPTQTSENLFSKMVKLAPMLSEITLLRVAGNINFETEGVRNAAAQHTENGTITGATDTLVKVSLTGYEYNKLLYVSKTVQTMSVNAFEGWLVDMLAEDIAAAIEDQIINGTGSSAPKGVEKANTWATASNLVVCTGTFVVTYADVLNMIAKLPARYDANAKFLASKAMVYQGLANIVDKNGRPVLVNDAVGAYPFKVLGYPVIVSDKVAEKTLYLGDYKKVVGNLAQDVIVEKDASAGFASNSIAYRGGAIFDCNIALADAFVKLTVATY